MENSHEKNKSMKWKEVTKKTPRKKKITFRWKPNKTIAITAGGMLPYDHKGIWVVQERNKNNPELLEYTDLGGRYNFDDGDIFATIAREFNEELYYSTEISRRNVCHIAHMTENVYINGHRGKPVYLCVLAPVEVLEVAGVHLNPEFFNRRREMVLQQNPDVPKSFYRPLLLKYITFQTLSTSDVPLSNRLKSVINESKTLKSYIQLKR